MSGRKESVVKNLVENLAEDLAEDLRGKKENPDLKKSAKGTTQEKVQAKDQGNWIVSLYCPQ